MKTSVVIVTGWLIVLSLVSCSQATPVTVDVDSSSDTQAENVAPTSEPTDEPKAEPTATDIPVEPVVDSVQIEEPSATPQPTTTPAAVSVKKEEEDKSMTDQPDPSGTANLVAYAKEDLAQRLNVEVDDIEAVEVQEVTWGDTSMGCPHPEMRYKQIPQDGLLIKLSVDGEDYEYHSGGTRDPFLCEQQTLKVKPKPTKIDIKDFVTPSSVDK
jgi:hypothetical protein